MKHQTGLPAGDQPQTGERGGWHLDLPQRHIRLLQHFGENHADDAAVRDEQLVRRGGGAVGNDQRVPCRSDTGAKRGDGFSRWRSEVNGVLPPLRQQLWRQLGSGQAFPRAKIALTKRGVEVQRTWSWVARCCAKLAQRLAGELCNAVHAGATAVARTICAQPGAVNGTSLVPQNAPVLAVSP